MGRDQRRAHREIELVGIEGLEYLRKLAFGARAGTGCGGGENSGEKEGGEKGAEQSGGGHQLTTFSC